MQSINRFGYISSTLQTCFDGVVFVVVIALFMVSFVDLLEVELCKERLSPFADVGVCLSVKISCLVFCFNLMNWWLKRRSNYSVGWDTTLRVSRTAVKLYGVKHLPLDPE